MKSTGLIMQTIRVHYITGNKGNVGKTGFANAMIEFYRKNGCGLIKIDADSDSQTLSKMYKDSLLLALSDNPSLASQSDMIFRLAYEESQKETSRSDVLVDLPAGGEKPINRWMRECGLNEDAETYGLTFYKWWVCDSDPNSIDLFESSLKEKSDVNHIFLKNMGRSEARNWVSFNKKKSLQSLIKKKSVPVLEIPSMDSETLNYLREKSITLEEANKSDFLKVDPAKFVRVQSWLRHTGRLIENVVTFDEAKDPVAVAAK